MALQTVTPLTQATSASLVMFCILNCLRGLGQASYYITSLVLGCELLSQTARMNFSLLGHSVGFGVGYALLPLFAYFIRGWRLLLVATAIPSFLLIPTCWVIPESPRWLLQKGRVQESEDVIHVAAKRNRVPAPEVIFRADECLEILQNEGEEKQTYTYQDLIRTPNIRNITILSVFICCFISAAIDIVVDVATWVLVNHVSRPTLVSSSLMCCGIMLLIIKLVPEDMHVMFQVIALMGKMGVSAAFSMVIVFCTELMPTVVRNMGLGVFSTAAHIGIVICPYVIYTGVYSKILPYLVFGTISIMAAAITMLLPDTRNDLIRQAKPIRGCCCPKQTAAAQLQLKWL